jgi:DNA-binding transcriptional regulator YiaG
VSSHRHELAALKQRIQQLERQIKSVGKRAGAPPEGVPAEADSGRQLRFSAPRLAAQRKRLGLSAADFAALIGVSPISVYKWEGGSVRPRQAQLEAIASIRRLGKREAQSRLDGLRSA